MKNKILLIIESLNTGGAEKVLVDIIKNLDFQNRSIDLLLIVKEGMYLKELPTQVNLLYLFKKRFHYRLVKKLTSLFNKNIFFKLILKSKLKKSYDTEISFLEGPTLKIHSLMQSNAKKISWVHTNLEINKWWLPAFFDLEEARKAYQSMHKIVFVSEGVLTSFENIFNNIHVKREVFHNPIDKSLILQKAKEFGPVKRKFTICTIGRLEPQKSYHQLIKAIKKLVDDNLDFELWILGKGNLENTLKQQAEKLNISSTIKFLGFKSNPYPYLKAADIFVNTSKTEGFPLVIAEALCLGKAIVATNVTGNSEILDHNRFGLLTGNNPEEIYNGLKKLIVDDNLREHYTKKASERSNIFDFDKSIQSFERLIS